MLRKKWIIAVAIAVALGVAAIINYLGNGQEDKVSYRTAQVESGPMVESVSTTGTLNAVITVQVGSQVSGQIKELWADYNSEVKSGDVIARIDDSVYAADAAQAEAQVRSGRAALQRTRADLGQLQAKLQQAERDWQRARKLGPSEALAEASFDAYRSAYHTAVANLDVGRAAIQQAEAVVAQSEAVLSKARLNLGYCTITSPVDGVVIERAVDIGQTVAAASKLPSSSPSLRTCGGCRWKRMWTRPTSVECTWASTPCSRSMRSLPVSSTARSCRSVKTRALC